MDKLVDVLANDMKVDVFCVSVVLSLSLYERVWFSFRPLGLPTLTSSMFTLQTALSLLEEFRSCT